MIDVVGSHAAFDALFFNVTLLTTSESVMLRIIRYDTTESCCFPLARLGFVSVFSQKVVYSVCTDSTVNIVLDQMGHA